mmetsp:Transcript_20277/g.48285  ORF Transcript_20277/g.48285 Transcript_20277/m.48285 type:complete len:234 (-) Transcript_20277:2150-2851(-)
MTGRPRPPPPQRHAGTGRPQHRSQQSSQSPRGSPQKTRRRTIDPAKLGLPKLTPPRRLPRPIWRCAPAARHRRSPPEHPRLQPERAACTRRQKRLPPHHPAQLAGASAQALPAPEHTPPAAPASRGRCGPRLPSRPSPEALASIEASSQTLERPSAHWPGCQGRFPQRSRRPPSGGQCPWPSPRGHRQRARSRQPRAEGTAPLQPSSWRPRRGAACCPRGSGHPRPPLDPGAT